MSTRSEHRHPDFLRGKTDALCLIVAAAGCMGSGRGRQFGEVLRSMRQTAEGNAEDSSDTTYWAGYLNAFALVERDLVYG